MGEANFYYFTCLKSFIKRLKLFFKDFCKSKVNNKDIKMQNEAGEYVDHYIPRKCSASNRIIGAGDHASVQINIAMVDEKTGRMTGDNKTYAICGKIRGMGESDDALQRLARKDGILPTST